MVKDIQVTQTALGAWMKDHRQLLRSHGLLASSAIANHLAQLRALMQAERLKVAEAAYREGFTSGVRAIVGEKEIAKRNIRFTHPDFVRDTIAAWDRSALKAAIEQEGQ